ncbi:MAG: signal recognition particle-docking protein FtsY [Acidobacteriota bacterium]|nr:signal recognition particle-docking protein FtsY [Acidobacteriota bacterium]
MLGRLRRRLRDGLGKTRKAITGQLQRIAGPGRAIDDALLDEVEEVLIGADLGVELTSRLRERMVETAKGRVLSGQDELLAIIREELTVLLPAPREEARGASELRVTLVVGVNGSGKTTTTGKLAARWAGAGRSVVVAAADTFRAAAVEQLVTWAERAGARVVRGASGTDPAAVAFDAVKSAVAARADDLLIDTAGRLHTKKPLMDELSKISRVVAREIPDAPHETLLVLDGTTGRNGLLQAREFSSVVPVSGLVLTKLDGTARGGVAVAIGQELGLPVRYVGVGESADDLLDFDPAEFVLGLLTPAGADSVAEQA